MSSNNNNKEEEIEKQTAEIEATIKETEKFVSVFLLTVLQSILNEQVKARQIKRSVANYVYLGTKDQAIRKGWID